ncbi:MAG TPA: hydroxyethylthiazole kinase [Bacillota bacterium]|nr:hydroxyethylthiazole kinase [Bacillota bacterium]
MDLLAKIKAKNPLIYNITNDVVANFSANGLLAIGASPVMANALQEAEDFAKHADAVILNVGTLTKDQAEAMLVAGQTANKKGIPVILDPVAIGVTPFRTNVIYDILSTIDVAAIRGNAGEIAFLSDGSDEVKGTDSLIGENDPHVAAEVAQKYQTVVMSTGKTDVVTDGHHVTLCRNGSAMLPYITGTGCLLTAVSGAFISVAKDVYRASVKAVAGYGIAAEIAREKAAGSGSFIPAFLDQLYLLEDQTIADDSALEEFTLKEKTKHG